MNWTKLLSAAVAALIFAGCQQQAPKRMTQEIVQGGVQPESSIAESSAQAALSQAPETSQANRSQGSQSLEELRRQYYQVKAQRDAVEIDIDNLETRYRIGEIAEADFLEQKKTLRMNAQTLGEEAQMLELQIKMQKQVMPPITDEPEAMIKQLLEIEAALDLLEVKENESERAYQMGEITADEFIAQRVSQIAEEELLEEQEDALEDTLELMGYDD